MMGIHYVENSDKKKIANTFTFLNTLLHSKVCCSSVHEIRVRRRRKFRTAGFVMQNFPDNASKLRQLAFYGDAKWHRLHYFALSLLFIFKCAFKLVELVVAWSHLVHFWDSSPLHRFQMCPKIVRSNWCIVTLIAFVRFVSTVRSIPVGYIVVLTEWIDQQSRLTTYFGTSWIVLWIYVCMS